MFEIRATLTLFLLMKFSVSPSAQETVTSCKDFADIAFVVDVSGSIEEDGKHPGHFDKYVKTFLKDFARKLQAKPGQVQIGMVTFGNRGNLEFPLKLDINEVIAGIDKVVYPTFGENTNTSGGINVMRTEVLGPKSPNYRPQAAHIAVVITDGQSNRDQDKTVPSANAAMKEGITMISIGFTHKINLKELTDIASKLPNSDYTGMKAAVEKGDFTSSGYAFYVPKLAGLADSVGQLTICQ